jgi:hypothetical protein
MFILCDTCSILMLIRIAPDMFEESRYECVTLQEVGREIFQTQKFKEKYPWRTKYKSKIKAIKPSEMEKGDFKLYLEAIQNMVFTGTVNQKRGHFFNLSRVDQMLAACAIAHNFRLTTVDGDLADFVEQEFSGTILSPLRIINDWIEKKLIRWNDDFQEILGDWTRFNEPHQPKKEANRFQKLTGYPYAGSK